MSNDLWIATVSFVVSVPVAVGGAYVAPYIQTWVDERGKASHAKKRSRIEDEYNGVLYYALHTDMLIGRLVITSIFMTLMVLTLLVCLLCGPLIGLSYISLFHSHASNVGSPVILVCTASIGITGATTFLFLFAGYAVRYMKLFSQVRHVEEYVKSIPGEIRDLKWEKIVLTARNDRAAPGLDFFKICFEKSKNQEQIDDDRNSDTTAP
ncbi:MAG: hypothetical protein ABR905_11145 [Terracidiphilus sp.]|jgi:hypothetical protein